jgi:hypothetical protein
MHNCLHIQRREPLLHDYTTVEKLFQCLVRSRTLPRSPDFKVSALVLMLGLIRLVLANDSVLAHICVHQYSC